MIFGVIGNGAISRYVQNGLVRRGHSLRALLIRGTPATENRAEGVIHVSKAEDLPGDIDHMIDCAGHSALFTHGPAILRQGMDLTTVSIGALADDDLHRELTQAASDGNATLHLASGAIGALDCLRAARVGKLDSVCYTGRKPPQGWKGSAAESKVDLDSLKDLAQVHFEGSARIAAREYPKNANVAAAVALSGIGFDRTQVKLVADPNVTENIHQLEVSGEFGRFAFEIRGHALPDNPKSSALAAMSVIAALEQQTQRVVF